MNSFEKINVGIGLADAELISYSTQESNLIIRIKAWNEKIIQFIFFDKLFFCDRGTDFITNFGKNNTENDLFISVLKKSYELVPKEHSYNLFQFLDLDDMPCLEIICKNFESKILEDY